MADELDSESFADMLSRVQRMADDNGETWDLSVNDRRALKAVLASRDELIKGRDNLIRALAKVEAL